LLRRLTALPTWRGNGTNDIEVTANQNAAGTRRRGRRLIPGAGIGLAPAPCDQPASAARGSVSAKKTLYHRGSQRSATEYTAPLLEESVIR
jgi:hypothetical protein